MCSLKGVSSSLVECVLSDRKRAEGRLCRLRLSNRKTGASISRARKTSMATLQGGECPSCMNVLECSVYGVKYIMNPISESKYGHCFSWNLHLSELAT